jgi:hypothetical protein
MLARRPVAALDVANFHGIRQHPRKPKRHPLRILFAVHSDFEAVAEIDVDDFSGDAIEHEIGRVAIAETEDVAHHGHDGERARVVGATVEPSLGRL